MNTLIVNSLLKYPKLFKTPSDVLHHLFCVIGNGHRLRANGFLIANNQSDQPYIFDKPEPLKYIFPFPSIENVPILEYKGCRDVGFKESVKYFIECINITPDTVEEIEEWKKNINIFYEVLEADTIEPKYKIEDLQKFVSDIQDEKITAQNPKGLDLGKPNSVYKGWIFDVQWSDCPNRVVEEVRDIWHLNDLGNDVYFYSTEVDEELFEEYPNVYFWLIHKGVGIGEAVTIKYWW